ncbi:MAG TPA: protein translocase subunit SecF [Stellaceae bacterium]|jgi:preprotein translocase subunit SecF|nr:protein translocase subunit SecF [Stellaceae bacterium]
MIRPLRLVPDGTRIRFMRGRFAGLIVSAVLSIASVVLFFYPGLNYGVDFEGGVVIDLRLAAAADLAELRADFGALNLGDATLQQFGSAREVMVRLGRQAEGEGARTAITAMLAAKFPGSEIRRFDAVGAQVSGELFHKGLLATSLSLLAVLFYIWFRFDWQFGVGVVGTLLLDVTKTVGFLAVTRIEVDLNAVAAILLLVGYSVTDKIVVYDRIRENLRKFKTMPLRELIDLSINQTLSRTVATSLTVLLSIVPLAVIGGEAIRGFALIIIFGIVVGTSSSIFIASPILLFLGQKRLRPELAETPRSVPAPG